MAAKRSVSFVRKKVIEIIKCSVCLEVPTEPKVLPCMHLFCLNCLQQLLDSTRMRSRLSCPDCREVAQVPYGGLVNFPTDFRVKQIEEQMAHLNRLGSTPEEDSEEPNKDLIQHLHELIYKSDTKLLKSILSQYPSSTRRSLVSEPLEGANALSIACEQNNPDLVKYLVVSCKADMDKRVAYMSNSDAHIVTPLWIVSGLNYMNIISILLENGADVNAPTNTDSTPIRAACYQNNINVVKNLVSHGADINIRNDYGESCLMLAVFKEFTELVRYLLSAECNINYQNNHGKTALHYAVEKKNIEIITLLLDHELCDVDLAKDSGVTALIMAAEDGSIELVQLLLKQGADPYLRADDATDAFLAASEKGHRDVLNVLRAWHTENKKGSLKYQ